MNMRTLLGSWAAPLLMHNHNQATAMNRASAAKAQGLDPAVYGVPLPGSNVTTTTNITGGGWLKGAILGSALLAAGAGTAYYGLHGNVPQPPPTTPRIVPPASTKDQEWDAIYERQRPDGTWEQFKRERLPKDSGPGVTPRADETPVP